MPKRDAEFWKKARLARDILESQYMKYPDVTHIDIGYAPDSGEGLETIALRIHVTEHWMQAKPKDRVNFPATIDKFPIVIISADQAALE